VRFEDMISKRQETMEKVMAFAFCVESVEGTYLEDRIKNFIENEEKLKNGYKPRSGKVNGNMKYYSEE
jgi:hypothetical protein